MNQKMEEMIALGAAYAVNCLVCMEYHSTKAREAGLTEEDLRDAIKIAEGVKAAAAKMTQKNAFSLFGEVKAGVCCPVGSECCS